MRINMLRHGLTRSNLERLYLGKTDEPLCAEGVEALRRFALDESVLKVYTSCKLRTRQTAEILYPNAEIIQLQGFDEIDFGDFEGRSYDELSENADYKNWLKSGCTSAFPNGESKSEFSERCVKTFRGLAEGTDGPLHLVVHGGTIMAILAELGFPRRDYFDWSVPCGAGYELEYEKNRLKQILEEGAK